MTTIFVPELPESVSDATVAVVHVQQGQSCPMGTVLCELETDKVMLEVPAPSDGTVGEVMVSVGDVVKSGQQLMTLQAGMVEQKAPVAEVVEEPQPVKVIQEEPVALPPHATPSERRKIMQHGEQPKPSSEPQAQTASVPSEDEWEKRVPMSRLRQRIAERLLESQHQTASLTTFQEVNLYQIGQLRQKYKESFEKQHKTRLGYMSFVVTACVQALQEFPAVNASIDGQDIVYHHYCDIGVAVSTERGLLVPVLRQAEHMAMHEIESQIRDFGQRAVAGKLALEEMAGGTFTISNGGVFGSMLSTPILNPPQSAILGMHNIVDRVIVEDGQMVIRPVMYLALTYDHRIIDGSTSVRFLSKVKQLLEDPARLVLEI